MQKRTILAIIILTIMLLLFLGSFAIAQKNNEEVEKENNSQKELFIQYLQEKLNELPEKEKEQFEEAQKMDPADLFLKTTEQSLN